MTKKKYLPKVAKDVGAEKRVAKATSSSKRPATSTPTPDKPPTKKPRAQKPKQPPTTPLPTTPSFHSPETQATGGAPSETPSSAAPVKKPRGKKGKGVQLVITEEDNKFLSIEAEEIFLRFKESRQVEQEQQLLIPPIEKVSLTDPEIFKAYVDCRNQLMIYKLIEMCEAQYFVFDDLVMEFYSNLSYLHRTQKMLRQSFVRGVDVDFSPLRITKLLNTLYLPDTACTLTLVKEQAINEEMINMRLCDGKAEWIQGKQRGTNTKVLKASSLSPIAKLFWEVVHNSLLPVRHKSSISKKRLWCLWAMVERKYIDVGHIVSEEIIECLGKNKSILPYGGIISRLCTESGVDISSLPAIKMKKSFDLSLRLAKEKKQLPRIEDNETVSNQWHCHAENMRIMHAYLIRLKKEIEVKTGLQFEPVPNLHTIMPQTQGEMRTENAEPSRGGGEQAEESPAAAVAVEKNIPENLGSGALSVVTPTEEVLVETEEEEEDDDEVEEEENTEEEEEESESEGDEENLGALVGKITESVRRAQEKEKNKEIDEQTKESEAAAIGEKDFEKAVEAEAVPQASGTQSQASVEPTLPEQIPALVDQTPSVEAEAVPQASGTHSQVPSEPSAQASGTKPQVPIDPID